MFLPLYAALMRRLGKGRDRDSRLRLELAMLGGAVRGQRRVARASCTGVCRRARRSGSSATTGCPRTSTCSRSAWGSPSCARGPTAASGRCPSLEAIGRARLAVVAARRAVLPGGLVLDRPARQASCSCTGAKAYEKRAALQRHRVLPAPARGVRAAGSRRHAPVPAAAADRVPRHDLVRRSTCGTRPSSRRCTSGADGRATRCRTGRSSSTCCPRSR